MENITISHLQEWKKRKKKFASITAYDATFSKLFFNRGINVMLVGDSLGMTIQGNNSTVQVTIENMIYHTHCVRKGAPHCLLLADMPFMSYFNLKEAFKNATALIQSGANIVKLEGGKWTANIVKKLTERGIPVCSHLGLTPQSINILGGYKVQCREKSSADALLEDAILLEKSGSKLLILECIPSILAKKITKKLSIPVIGIGAGSETDGQILVMQDVLGLTFEKRNSFSKNFLNEKNSISDAITCYVKEVESKQFPSIEYSFH